MGALYISECNIARKKLQKISVFIVQFQFRRKNLQFLRSKKRKFWSKIRILKMALVKNAQGVKFSPIFL
jgi:hypothetical protein